MNTKSFGDFSSGAVKMTGHLFHALMQAFVLLVVGPSTFLAVLVFVFIGISPSAVPREILHVAESAAAHPASRPGYLNWEVCLDKPIVHTEGDKPLIERPVCQRTGFEESSIEDSAHAAGNFLLAAWLLGAGLTFALTPLWRRLPVSDRVRSA